MQKVFYLCGLFHVLVTFNEGSELGKFYFFGEQNANIYLPQTINGYVSKAINGAAGVYVLRLIDEKEVRTQKIVIQ